MVKNRIVLSVLLLASFTKLFSSEQPSRAASSSSSPAALGYCPSTNLKVALGSLVAASVLDAYEGNAVLDFNVNGDHKFVKVGCVKAGLKVFSSSKNLFDKLAKNELSLSANVLGEAKVQVTTGQLGLVAATVAALKYVAPLLRK
jgi:hypothetical protein